ncbi:hypothetical protein CC2G_007665 [Coprinopsis cinerea AmutBmut pab1-1]|nr:hypothetical protein CC2G_007665 [Coprinopsis cinerea AmutBmut pab1-1]
MEELPLEIWFLITEFFTDEDLYNVIGVNRFFFNLGMNKKYREVTLDTGDRKIRRWLVRVSDQGIASRIRRLILHIHPVNEPAPQEQSQRSLLDFLFLALDRVRHGTASNPSPKLEPLDVNGMIDKFVTVLPLMTGIEDFRIVTWALPPHYNLDQLYLTAWSIFGKNLRRISICANLGGYKSLLKSILHSRPSRFWSSNSRTASSLMTQPSTIS